jgi:phosphomannomutase/phosphoglucomutase
MTSFFHAYDLRGKYPDEIGKEEAKKVGKAYGTFTDAEEVLVGRDGREHAEEVAEAFREGIRSTGTDVADAGMVPTPSVYFAMQDRGYRSSAVVTASHNPPEYTGFKFTKENALAMSREGGMKQIQEIYESEEFETGEGDEKQVEVLEDYGEFLAERSNFEEFEVAVNYGNSVSAEMHDHLESLGMNINAVNREVDGSFPSHLPDPGNEEAQEYLEERMGGEQLGIIFDGDGDRAGFILPGHGYIGEDEVLSLFAEQALVEKDGKVLHDLRASKLVKETITENGGEPMETRVGHTFFSEEIHQDHEIVFAGELSGHYYFPAFGAPWDDGFMAAVLMSNIASASDLNQKLDDLPEYPVSPELRIDCPEDRKQPVIEGVREEFSDHEISTVDGVKIYFEEGWALVRPSNTEEKMSVRCEADDEESLDRILSEVEGKVRELI